MANDMELQIGFSYDRKDLENMLGSMQKEIKQAQLDPNLTDEASNQLKAFEKLVKSFVKNTGKDFDKLKAIDLDSKAFDEYVKITDKRLDSLEKEVLDIIEVLKSVDSSTDLSSIGQAFDKLKTKVTESNNAIKQMVDTATNLGAKVKLDIWGETELDELIEKTEEARKIMSQGQDAFKSNIRTEKGYKSLIDDLVKVNQEISSLKEQADTLRAIEGENSKDALRLDAQRISLMSKRYELAQKIDVVAGKNDFEESTLATKVISIAKGNIVWVDKIINKYKEMRTAAKEGFDIVSSEELGGAQGAINVVSRLKITTTDEEMFTVVKNKLANVQKKLQDEPLMVPVKMIINTDRESGNILGTSDAEINKAKKDLKKTKDEVSLDIDKLYAKIEAKAIKNATKAAKDAIKDAQAYMIANPVALALDVPETEIEKVGKLLASSYLDSKIDISKTLGEAVNSSKQLLEIMQKIYGQGDLENISYIKKKIKEEANALEEAEKKTSKSKKKTRDEELEQVRQDAKDMLAAVQDVFNNTKTKVKLILEKEQLDRVKDKLKDANLDESIHLVDELKAAVGYANDIAEALNSIKKTNITIKSAGNGNAEDIEAIKTQTQTLFAASVQLDKKMNDVQTTLSNMGKASKGTKKVSVDFEQITSKIDELINTVKELFAELNTQINTIDGSFKELGKAIDSSLNEAKVHSVVEEVKQIDLSTLERSLARIYEWLIKIDPKLEAIALNIKALGEGSLDGQWQKIAKQFHSIADSAGQIDLRKHKKDAEELVKALYEYKQNGGTNSIDMLTKSAETIEKLQKIASKNHGTNFQIIDNEKIRETREQLSELDSILASVTSSLTDINGLQNVNKVFNSLNIKDETLKKITKLPDDLKLISERIREIDNAPYSGFIKQLNEITKQAEGLKSLAEVLKHSKKQIDAALELQKKEPNEIYKELMASCEATSELEKEIKRLEKVQISDPVAAKEYNDVLDLMREKLSAIGEIRKSHLADEKTEAATIGQIYDARKVKEYTTELKDASGWAESIIENNKNLTTVMQEEVKISKEFAKQYNKIASGGGTKERKYSKDYIDLLRKIQTVIKETEHYDGFKVVNEDEIARIKSLNEQLESMFRTLSSISTYANDTDAELNTRMQTITQMANAYERRFSKSWGLGNIGENYPEEYSVTLKIIRQTLEQIKSIGELKNITEAEVKTAEQLARVLQECEQKLIGIEKFAKPTKVSNLANKMAQYLQKNTNLSSGQFNAIVEQMNKLKPGITTRELNEVATAFNNISLSAKMAGREGSSFLDAIRNKLKYGWAQSIAMFFSFYDIIRYIREVSSAVTELNSNLIELSKVSNATITELYGQFGDFADIAKETGGTINDIIEATANWSRNGYNLSDSKELAKLSSIFQNIGDGLTADQSNEYLVSILKGFNLEAKDAINILDIVNNVSNNAASSVSNIGEALERSSSAFSAANTDLEEAVALLTTSNEVLQNPENVGTAFKSKLLTLCIEICA